MDKIRRNELFYDSALIYKDSLLYEGEDILGSFKNDEKDFIEESDHVDANNQRQYRKSFGCKVLRGKETRSK